MNQSPERRMTDEEIQVQEFNKLISQLAKMRWTFEVYKLDMMTEDDMLVKNVKSMKQYLGQDIRVIYFPVENTEYILYEFDVNGVILAREELENWD